MPVATAGKQKICQASHSLEPDVCSLSLIREETTTSSPAHTGDRGEGVAAHVLWWSTGHRGAPRPPGPRQLRQGLCSGSSLLLIGPWGALGSESAELTATRLLFFPPPFL